MIATIVQWMRLRADHEQLRHEMRLLRLEVAELAGALERLRRGIR